jgi:hypothetical protein
LGTDLRIAHPQRRELAPVALRLRRSHSDVYKSIGETHILQHIRTIYPAQISVVESASCAY